MYACRNRPQSEMTATPKKYPQGKFKDKSCKCCTNVFSPQAPSHSYCSQECADSGLSSAYLKRTYGIDITEYKALLTKQNNVCKICSGEGFIMAEHHKMKLVVDHCHETGKVRGLLCHNCNRALGLFHDKTDVLTNAINYLEGATTIPKGSTLK
jgi:hypothetical protein